VVSVINEVIFVEEILGESCVENVTEGRPVV
jgi:hypothetical protein